MRKIYFIYNPHSGKEQIGSKLNEIIRTLAEKDNELTVVPTIGYLDAMERITNLPDGYDLVVCSGGDGTLDEVVTGMMKRPKERRVPIGYIPAGTTNDFARSLEIPRNMPEAAKNAMMGRPFACDIGSFNDDSFVYIASFGIFTEVSYSTKQEIKNVLGHMAYILEGMRSLYNVKSYKMKVSSDEMEFEGDFLFGMITNSKSVAGFKGLVRGDVQFDDGVYEVTFIKRPKNPLELQEILTALLTEELHSDYMYSFRTRRLTIESEEMVPWTLDGEFGGEHCNVLIENNQQAVEIIINSADLPKKEEEIS
ncbi:MAG: YegS/Rv2252/BmrU family lipid kinase [Lachnospiraceae bacterium]|nr:YegS/Rv2252/BmrU family lipid kinase [Lachnospiraceae bacterium]MEE1014837.1 YegS/Rv2252/BmrU family lipid kinase [Lachnospiraceae bacterium]